MQGINVIRETESVCPECFAPLKALVIEKQNKIFFQKSCPRHGNYQILLSEHAWYYIQNSQFFFRVMDKDLPQDSYHLYLTDRCNLLCPMCITQSGHNIQIDDLSKGSIKDILKNNKKARFILFGGEPTCHKELAQIIKDMKRDGHMVMMCTNGLKLANLNYLKELVDAGLARVDLSFDGFNENVYKVVRNADLLKIKLKVLDNLKKINLPTGLSMLVIRGLNEDQINPVLEYAVRNTFVKNVSFLALTFMGGAFRYPLDRYIVPDQIVDLVEKYTDGKINRNKLFFYQKAFNAYSSFIKKRRCFWYQSFVLVRKKSGYITIDNILDFKMIDHELEMYARHLKTNKFLSNLYLLRGIIKLVFYATLKPMGLRLILDILRTIFLYALPRGNYNQSRLLLNIIFTTACDTYKWDKAVGLYCHRGIFYAQNNKVRCQRLRFDYNIDMERSLRSI